MKFIIDTFKNRAIGFWLGFGAAVLALVAAIAYLILFLALSTVAEAERNYSAVTFVMLLLGSIGGIAIIFFKHPLLNLLPVIFLSIGAGIHLYTAIPSITDLFTGVNFYGGNQTYGIAFIIITMICAALSVLSCFLSQRKADI